jgi:hypothetical protein
MFRNLIILIAICAAGYYLQKPKEITEVYINEISEHKVSYDSSLSIKKEPIQKKVKRGTSAVKVDGYVITPIAEFQVAARVLGVKHYSRGREADLSPVDLALGWGPMAKDAVLDSIDIKQRNRFYYWWTDNFPIPRKDIETNSANMHFIPATSEVGDKLNQIDKDDKVKFKGYLVKIQADDGWRWNSSITRNDTGKGACEVILIDDISVF